MTCKYRAYKCTRHAYHRIVLPLTHWGHHSSQVCFSLLLVLILRVPDQVCVHRSAFTVALQSVQLHINRYYQLFPIILCLHKLYVALLEWKNTALPLGHRVPSACLSVQEHFRWFLKNFPLCSAGIHSTPSQTQPHWEKLPIKRNVIWGFRYKNQTDLDITWL